MNELFLRQLSIVEKTKDSQDYKILCGIILSIVRANPKNQIIKAIDYLIRKRLKQDQGLMFAFNADGQKVLLLHKFHEVI